MSEMYNTAAYFKDNNTLTRVRINHPPIRFFQPMGNQWFFFLPMVNHFFNFINK